MNNLKKLWALPCSEQYLLLRAGLLLLAVEAGLRLLPFRKLLAWAQNRSAHAAAEPSPERIAYLVDVAARHTLLRGSLRPTCLRKSLVVCKLLSRRGRDARLVIGTGSLAGNFQAHAWVELDGRMLGNTDAREYTALVAFERPAVGRQIA
jgi:hypothetical protein